MSKQIIIQPRQQAKRKTNKPRNKNRKNNNKNKKKNRNMNLVNLPNSKYHYTNTGMSNTRYKTREFFASINGSEVFTVDQFKINPANSKLFPYLSKAAILFEEYRFKSLRIVYTPSVTEFSDVGKQGNILFYVDRNANDAAPVSKREMLNSAPSVEGYTNKPLSLDIPISILNSPIAIFVGASPELLFNVDIATYNIGNLYVAKVGQASEELAGDLFVEYEIEFINPVLETSKPPSLSKTVNEYFLEFNCANNGTGNLVPFTLGSANPLNAFSTGNGTGDDYYNIIDGKIYPPKDVPLLMTLEVVYNSNLEDVVSGYYGIFTTYSTPQLTGLVTRSGASAAGFTGGSTMDLDYFCVYNQKLLRFNATNPCIALVEQTKSLTTIDVVSFAKLTFFTT